MINLKLNVFKTRKPELYIISVCSLIILIIELLTIANWKGDFGGDTIPYINVAENIARGNGFITNFALSFERDTIPSNLSWWQPLFPLLISFFIKIGVDSIIAAFLVSSIFLGLIPFVLFYLAKELYGKKAAYFSIFYFTFYFPLIEVAAFAQTETTYIFFVLLTLFFLSKIEYSDKKESFLKNKKLLFLSGISVGLVYLTRGNGLLLFLLPIVCIFWLSGTLNSFRKITNLIISLFAGFLIVSLPWLVRNYILFKAPFYYGQSYLFHRPDLKALFWILYRVEIDLFPLILIIPCTIKYLTTKEYKKYVLIILYPLITVFFFTTWPIYCTRLLIPIYPLLVIVGMKMFLDVILLFEKKFQKINIISNYFLSSILIVAATLIPNIVSIRHFAKTPPLITIDKIKKSTEWIKENVNKDDVILSNSLYAYYLTKIKMVYTGELPWSVPTNYSIFESALKRFNIKYVILYKNSLQGSMGQYIFNLQNGIDISAKLIIVYNGADAIIYKVNKLN